MKLTGARVWLGRAIVTLALVTTAIVADAGVANADIEDVGWYTYPGFQSTWSCNTTSTYDLGGDQGWAYVQACISVHQNSEQGLYNFRFSDYHDYVDFVTQDEPVVDPYGRTLTVARHCSGHMNGGVTMTCFAPTVTSNSSMWAVGYDPSFFVDGNTYSLRTPKYGPSQISSPISHW